MWPIGPDDSAYTINEGYFTGFKQIRVGSLRHMEPKATNDLLVEISTGGIDRYSVTVSSVRGSFRSSFPHQLPASVKEDLRLLRWKAVGLRDPGDKLLIDVGQRLA